MDPKDFFKTAEKLKDSSLESDLRTSVGRSYYAIFLHFRDYLASLGLKKKDDKGVHFFVQACLSNSQIKKVQHLSAILGDLKDKRTKADYHLKENILKDEANDVYEDALEAVDNFYITTEDEIKLIENVKKAPITNQML